MSQNDPVRYTESANKCHGCGEQPMIQLTDHPLNGPSYEMGCETCHMYTGPWPTPDEAAIKWNEISPKGEKVHKDEVYQKYIDEARRCSVCGKPPIIARYNGYQMYAPTHYSFDCKECARTTGPLVTILAAKTEWDKLNSPTISLRGKRVNPCKNCGAEVQLRFDKGRHAYEIECTKCKNGVIAQKMDSAIFGWNELNPVTPPLKWSYEGSKVLATKQDPPKDRYLHYEGRINELSNAIHDRLEWMAKTKQCGAYSAAITLSDWNYLEEWATELLETIRYRREELL